MALRLVERGVRMVQIYFGNGQPWDNYEDIMVHEKLARQADRPIAALLGDLKARVLLNETLVVCGGDFGFKPVENPAHVHDVHATIVYPLGLDHEKLTYRYSGRDFRLTDVTGRVIHDVIA